MVGTGGKFWHKLGGLAMATASRNWMRTLDFQTAYFDASVDPAIEGGEIKRIYLFWHEYIPFQFYLRGNCNVSMLLSRNDDAELLSRAARHMGFDFVRGSTFRGGSVALRQLLHKSRHMHLTMTPDGPRGPRRRMSMGPIFLSSKLRVPLVAIGMGYDRPWRLATWDRFAVPRPYSRARSVWSPPLQIPRGLDRDGIEHYRKHVEELLNRLTAEAEAWAESGTRKINQVPTRRQPAIRQSFRVHRGDQRIRSGIRLCRSAKVTHPCSAKWNHYLEEEDRLTPH
jgi:hypothetical protein